MITIDPEKQKQAKEYERIRHHLWLVNTVFSMAYALVWLLPGWSVSLRTWLTRFTTNEWLIVPAFVLIFSGLFSIIKSPLSYYSGFVLPHRYGQSNQTFKEWIIDRFKGLVVGAILGLILLELLYLALRVTGDLWWLWAAGGMLVFSVLLANLAPILIMPLFNKFVPLGEEHKDLEDRLLALAKRANTKVRGVFKFDMSRQTKAANAALTGVGNTRRIVLGDTLINEFSTDEIEVVLAHELGHHVNRDIPLFMILGTISTTLSLYLVSIFLNWSITYFGFASVADVAAFPALGIILGAYGLVTMPLDNALSRWRERKADRYALQATGKHDAFESAFTRLANQNLGDVDPEKWVVFLFYSHPPLGERIAMAQNWTPG